MILATINVVTNTRNTLAIRSFSADAAGQAEALTYFRKAVLEFETEQRGMTLAEVAERFPTVDRANYTDAEATVDVAIVVSDGPAKDPAAEVRKHADECRTAIMRLLDDVADLDDEARAKFGGRADRSVTFANRVLNRAPWLPKSKRGASFSDVQKAYGAPNLKIVEVSSSDAAKRIRSHAANAKRGGGHQLGQSGWCYLGEKREDGKPTTVFVCRASVLGRSE